MRAAIVGIEGTALSVAEASLFAAFPPAGVILFARNVENPRQLAGLTAGLRAGLPPEAVLMVDQEGGRVARLRPPAWRAHPAAAWLGRLYDADRTAGLRAAWLTGALIGCEASAAGIDVVTAPVLDLGLPGMSAVVGDRALHAEPRAAARLGRALAGGLLAAGIQPVMKHIPGHGQARVDSHVELPTVATTALARDLLPFAVNAALPWAMVAHIRYTHWDAAHPASLSEIVIEKIIRGRIGFQGVLVSDDLAMQAIAGTPAARATGTLAAGADLALYCSGERDANREVLAALPELSAAGRLRLAHARAMADASRKELDPDLLGAERDRLLGA
ncbi:MAG: beta-N-acetylhexosaminidase [Acetobacteraceae bacterium]